MECEENSDICVYNKKDIMAYSKLDLIIMMQIKWYGLSLYGR